MGRSIEEALKKAGVKKEQFKQAKERQESERRPPEGTEVDFSRKMKKERVVVYPERGTKRAYVYSEKEGRSEALQPPAQAKLAGEFSRYLVKIEGAYDAKPKTAKAKTQGKATGSLEIIGSIVPNPLLVKPDLLESHVVSPGNDGIAAQLANPGTETDELDVVIGLDFGTSTVKAVIRDTARRAFAVPFIRHDPDNPYLLPSRVFEFHDAYHLQKSGAAHRPLKLSVISANAGAKDFERAVAFLALVIRYARGWLLATHADIYAHSKLNWAINIGLPAANYQERAMVDRFRAIASGALLLASDHTKVISSDLAAKHYESGRQLVRQMGTSTRGEVQTAAGTIDVVPEIAAQVHGFVQSTRFDPRAPNVFMMIDVGAGTVDASIFHARREAGGRQGFVCFANTVEQNGAINLHRERVKWFRDQFRKIAPPNAAAQKELDNLEQPTDRLVAIPESIRDYFAGIALRFDSSPGNPDELFFTRRYWRQVFGDTLSAVRNRKLSDEQLVGLPTFLSGGGARMNYYERLVRQLNNNSNVRWARLDRVLLDIPQELVAPGLRQSEFDRLSVAYGLSFVQLGNYVRAQDVPDLAPERASSYYDRFISKDQM